MPNDYDAILFCSFGGPEGKEDVIPFLENVLRGKNVPHQRMLEVAEHYNHFGGVSPINEQNRKIIALLKDELKTREIKLPVYWGNRNWHPLFADTLKQMANDGVRKCLALVTSSFSSYSGCRQYREDLAKALQDSGTEIEIQKIRAFYDHPGFLLTVQDETEKAWKNLPLDRKKTSKILFAAHSIPDAMSRHCNYVAQLQGSCHWIASRLDLPTRNWQLVFQSRSGPPTQPWLEPDICDEIQRLKNEEALTDVVVVPIGFLTDHMEVLFDLDTEAKELCETLGIGFQRVATVGHRSGFISGLADLIVERLDDLPPSSCQGLTPAPNVCPADCCLSGRSGTSPLPAVSQAELSVSRRRR